MSKHKKTEKEKPKFSVAKLIYAVLGLLVLWGVYALATAPRDMNIVYQTGGDRHAHLHIYIHGTEASIPGGIGLSGQEQPIHTHAEDNTIHMEFSSAVHTNDVRLARFFEEWGKKFTSTCIIDSCNGNGGTVSMKVNGVSNTEFEQYVMKDGDSIEIRFE